MDKDDLDIFARAKDWLDRYFAGKQPAITDLPLAPTGSEFRQEVWRILCEIPYGKVTTYGQIAKEMAVRMGKERISSQAVGGAVGHNPISIIIPCHRVVGADGDPGNVAGQRWCSGTLIADDLFLSAAHCFEPTLSGWKTPRRTVGGVLRLMPAMEIAPLLLRPHEVSTCGVFDPGILEVAHYPLG